MSIKDKVKDKWNAIPITAKLIAFVIACIMIGVAIQSK